MTTTQTQLRRDTATNIGAATPAAGEPYYDTTNKRLGVGDGTTAGGIPHASAADVQRQSFVYSTVGGTANAITLTNVPPVTAYTTPLRLVFKATGTNSTAVTVNVDGLGTKNIYKMLDGALTALVSGDLVSGGIYEIYYDGTQFQVQGLSTQTPESLPAAVTGTLSGGSTVFTVDFTTYSGYQLDLSEMQSSLGSTIVIEVSSNGGSTYAAINRFARDVIGNASAAYDGVAGNSAGTLGRGSYSIMQASTSGATVVNGTSGGEGGSGSGKLVVTAARHATSAAVNRIRIGLDSGTFSGGNVILQPISKR